jgi:pimeloyl-ACP methyl ester carboxylesterase
MSPIPYDASRKALYFPCRGAMFFPNGLPASEALLCAEMSRLAYCKAEASQDEEARVRGILRAIGFAECAFFNNEGTQGFLARSATLGVLAFRGTEATDPRDLITDIRFKLEPWDSGRVHSGFRDAIGHVWTQVKAALDACSVPLLFTGHSLGAALATLAASRHRPRAVYTFGSPHVGDSAFTAMLQRLDVQRYVDCCDDVAVVLSVIPGYVHIGTLQYADRHGRITADPAPEEVARDQRHARRDYAVKYAWRFWKNVLTRKLADHAPINYVSALAGRA